MNVAAEIFILVLQGAESLGASARCQSVRFSVSAYKAFGVSLAQQSVGDVAISVRNASFELVSFGYNSFSELLSSSTSGIQHVATRGAS